MDEKKIKHRLIIEAREKILVTGVKEVLSFDEQTIIAQTDMGALVIKGAELHVTRLNLDSGELDIDGRFNNLIYEEHLGSSGKNLFSRMFK